MSAFHATVILSYFSFLPCSNLECFFALDNFLKENNIAVSFIVHFHTELIRLITANQFVTAAIVINNVQRASRRFAMKNGRERV